MAMVFSGIFILKCSVGVAVSVLALWTTYEAGRKSNVENIRMCNMGLATANKTLGNLSNDTNSVRKIVDGKINKLKKDNAKLISLLKIYEQNFEVIKETESNSNNTYNPTVVQLEEALRKKEKQFRSLTKYVEKQKSSLKQRDGIVKSKNLNLTTKQTFSGNLRKRRSRQKNKIGSLNLDKHLLNHADNLQNQQSIPSQLLQTGKVGYSLQKSNSYDSAPGFPVNLVPKCG